MNLLEEVNQLMGSPLTHAERTEQKKKTASEKTLAGAAIPATLAGIYHLASKQEGAEALLKLLTQGFTQLNQLDLLTFTFAEAKEKVVQQVSNYSAAEVAAVTAYMNETARQACLLLVKKVVTPETQASEVTQYLVAQRHNILMHLPDELQLGQFLGDETIDDVSNKMSGPISTLMHNLGEGFSSSPR